MPCTDTVADSRMSSTLCSRSLDLGKTQIMLLGDARSGAYCLKTTWQQGSLICDPSSSFDLATLGSFAMYM